MRTLATLFGGFKQIEEDLTEVHADATLAELEMSHGDLASLLRAALKAQHPGPDIYCWVRDVFDAEVVYELSTRDDVSLLYRRTYSVDDAGAVTLGEPVSVIATTTYVPVTESDRQVSHDPDDLEERSFTQDQRDAMAKSGEAMSDGGFPIATKGDLRNAIQAYGRAANKPAVKRHIKKRAKALGATDLLPEDWRESDRDEITGELVPLVEKAVKDDGTATIRIIAPGQGSSGYYPADVLQRDGPRVFGEGLQIYLDHPSASEDRDRPERSVKDLAGALTGPAEWKEDGLYAPVKFVDSIAPHINAIAPISGMSIRASGKAGTREVDGKKVRSIESIDVAHSVDVVTRAGAGGKVVDLIESARKGEPIGTQGDGDEMSKEALEEAQREIQELKGKIAAQEAREREAALLAEARTVVVATLAGIAGLQQPTRERLAESLAANPPTTAEGALDREALKTKVTEAATAEVAYITSLTGGNPVRGMGGTGPTTPQVPTLEESGKRIEAALAAL